MTPDREQIQTRSGDARGLSIVDFLTDGSLAGLCDRLGALSGRQVSLLDAEGRRIRRAEGQQGWRVDESGPATGGAVQVPLMVGSSRIGSIRIAGENGQEPDASLVEASRLLASAVQEMCERAVQLEHRANEIKVLYRLSSMLVHTTKIQATLDVALDSALDALGLDAGSIALFDRAQDFNADREEGVIHRASRNLSRDWMNSTLPLSRGRLFDRLMFDGEVVVSENLHSDDRVVIGERAIREGLASFIGAGLVFRDRPIGVIRLYGRRPCRFEGSDRRLLESIAQQVAVAVRQAQLLKLEEEDRAIRRQLQLASDVQQRMLPRRVPAMPPFDVAARYRPSLQLGGDFYDIFEVGSSLALAVGDVVGKGVAAALLMSMVRASIRAFAQDESGVAEVITRANASMARDTLPNEFATLWYALADPESLDLVYCSAGHDPPFLAEPVPGGVRIEELELGGMVAGVDASQRYEQCQRRLRPGQALVAYTDGLTDAMDFQGHKFGRDRLESAVRHALTEDPAAPTARILERIFWELRQFAGLSDRTDDQTIIVLRVLSPS